MSVTSPLPKELNLDKATMHVVEGKDMLFKDSIIVRGIKDFDKEYQLMIEPSTALKLSQQLALAFQAYDHAQREKNGDDIYGE